MITLLTNRMVRKNIDLVTTHPPFRKFKYKISTVLTCKYKKLIDTSIEKLIHECTEKIIQGCEWYSTKYTCSAKYLICDGC